MDPGTIVAVVTASAAALSHIVEFYSDVKEAKQDRERLCDEVKALHDVLENVQSLASGPNAGKVPALSSYVKASCLPDIEELEARLAPGKGRRAMKKVGLRALKWPFDKKEVDKYISRLERHKSTISAALGIDQTSLIVNIDQNVTQLHHGHDLAELDRLLAKLSYTGDAAFNSRHHQHEPRCIPNTRVDLLHRLTSWSSSSEKCIFWLSGMAGTGKSTIARTIAASVSDQGHLGASFFFSRGQGDLGHAGKFVSTLAYQLAIVSSPLKRLICDAIAQRPDITHQSLSNQWKELIIQPLSKLDGSKSHLVLVIDALDECEREDDIETILQLFIKAKSLTTVRLRVILTSRPEIAFRLGFQDMPEILHQNLDLRNIPRETVQHDISEFLKHEFSKIRKSHGLPIDWPDGKNTELLVKKSDGLFIYAATACRFVGDRNWNPKKQLFLILQDVPDSSSTANLDNMYLQILRLAINEGWDEKTRNELVQRFRKTLGSIIVSFDVLSSPTLENLLSIEKADLDLALSPLHSVLDISKNRKSPIRLLHPSFRDFLLARERCRDDRFWIDRKLAHANFAQNCLRLLFKALKRNMCNFESSGHLARKIWSDQVEICLPKSVQYACCYWVAHVEQVDFDHRNEIGLSDNGHVHSFFQQHFLHWLEALTLIRRISEGRKMMAKLQNLFNADENPALSAMVNDAMRFIDKHGSTIAIAPLQSYVSALVFSPKSSVIRNQYLDQFPTWVKCLSGAQDDWQSLPKKYDGHSERVSALSFSSDGRFVASASEDQTVRIWKATTGALHYIFEGHSGSVTAVAFSSSDWLVASGSDDRTVQIWNATTGTLHHTFSDHPDRIEAVTFSPNDQLVASASADKTVRLWNTATGTLHRTLEGHIDQVRAVALSNDHQLDTSPAKDTMVRLWSAMTGALHPTSNLYAHLVSAVAFSPHGELVASAQDGMIRLWNTETKEMIGRFNAQDIKKLFISPDGSLIKEQPGQTRLTCNVRPTSAKLRTKLLLKPDRNIWIFWGGHEELMLPWRYRGCCSAVWENRLVIGSEKGFLLFFESNSDSERVA